MLQRFGEPREVRPLLWLVLGSGASGKSIAWETAKESMRTAVVERKLIGGTCPNGCLASKNVIHTAKVASLFARHQEFGIETGPVTINMAGVYRRKRSMVDDLIQLHLGLYESSGAELILGEGRFIEPRTLEVTRHPRCVVGSECPRWRAGRRCSWPYAEARSPSEAPRAIACTSQVAGTGSVATGFGG